MNFSTIPVYSDKKGENSEGEGDKDKDNVNITGSYNMSDFAKKINAKKI